MDISSTNSAKKDIISAVADVLRQEQAMAISIESAVDRAGIDRDQVSATFGSMHGLMLDMVSELSEAMAEPLTFPAADRAVRDVLIEFGNRLAHTHSDSHLNALYRIALTEATRHSGIGRDFFERGPGRLTMCLAQYLEGSARRFNQLRIGDAKRVAENFLSLLGDILEFSDCTTATRTTSTNNHGKLVNEAVDLFCHGIITGGQ